MTEPNDNPLTGVDRPRALPSELRARLEEDMVGGASSPLPSGLDRPRPIPPATYARVERTVLAEGRKVATRGARRRPVVAGRPGGPARQWVPLVAAVLALVVGVAGALQLMDAGSPAGRPSTALSDGRGGPGPDALLGAPPPFSEGPVDFSTEAGGRAAAGEAGAPAPEASGDFDAAASAQSDAAASEVQIGLSGPDNEVARGFRAYMDRANSQGGVGNRRVETVNPSTEGILSTVNTSLRGPLAPSSAGPRLESPAASEARLRDDNFSFAAAPERLAHLLVDALYPQPAPGSRVAVFTGSGVFDDVVPSALATAFAEKGVAAVRVSTRDGRPSQWPASAVAVLSMTSEESVAWLAAAREEGYSTPRGFAGLWNLADPKLSSELPEGSMVMTPYAMPRAPEAAAMTEAAGGAPSFAFVHGWATAKGLALALWRSGATTPSELTAALANFGPDDLGGLIPPYRVRPGTNSRTPEGLLLVVRDRSFQASGGFRADPR